MTLSDLRSYLGKGKLKFLEDGGGRHLDYRPLMDGQEIVLPTVLRVSHGRGEAAFNNIKGVAQALGLSVRELQTSQRCKLGRFCVLLKLAFHLVNWSRQRGDNPDACKGTAAMVESVKLLLEFAVMEHAGSWNGEEKKALRGICRELDHWKKTPELSEIAAIMLSQINRQ